MRLIRFGPQGHEKPGVLTPDGRRKDFSGEFRDWDREFFEGGGLERLEAKLGNDWEGGLEDLPDVAEDERMGPPIPRPGKILGIGLNYADHAAESGEAPPTEPVMFQKAASSLCGPDDPLLLPRGSDQTDWEVELGVIIGSEARYLDSAGEAVSCIAGYTICHDVSERHFQRDRGGQWTKGKSADHFCPLGPWLATEEELDDVGNLDLSTQVNGELKQTGNTQTMIFPVEELVRYASQFMTLEPGDLLTTGTPPGVGMGHHPPQFLRPGDMVRLAITGLGVQEQVCERA